MKVSVALCTYNGSKYIEAQLQSILDQTIVPDEIVVCDDCSSDNTTEIIKKFSQQTSVPIPVHINAYRIGVTKNFKKAIEFCTHDFIALSDQDDVWLPGNLKEKIDFLQAEENRQINVVFSDLQLANQNMEALSETMWQRINFTAKEKSKWEKGQALDILCRRDNVVTGATIVFRNSFRKKFIHYLDTDFNTLIHDGIIAVVAAKENSIQFIRQCSILYRQHSLQQIGAGEKFIKPSLKNRLSEIVKGKISLDPELKIKEDRMSDFIQLGIEVKKIPSLKKFLQHIRNRRQILRSSKTKRIYLIAKDFFLLRYKKYSQSLLLDPVRDFIHKRVTDKLLESHINQ